MTALASASPLYRSAAWSLMGTVIPMITGIVAVPLLIGYLGQERLGILSLIWVIVGYFSFLDMGLGRAVTIAVASARPSTQSDRNEELQIVGTASILLASAGCLAALLLGIYVLVFGVPLRLSSVEFLQEVTLAMLWMLPSLPLLLLSSALRGHLEAVGAFKALNLLRIPTGTMLVIAPCITAMFSAHLVWACIAILLVRLVHVGVLLYLVAGEMRFDFWHFVARLVTATRLSWVKRLLAFGGWATVSNIVGPIIVYVDRFVIGALLTASLVASYSVPFDVVSRLPILVAALCSVLLPELARLSRIAEHSSGDSKSMRSLVTRSTFLSAWVIAALVVGCVILAPWGLRAWMGPEFAAQSARITQILLLAFGVNALAQIPFTALQAVGRVRSVAWLHLAELLPYAVLLYFAISVLGIEGAAWAALLRSAIDYGALSWMWHRRPTGSASSQPV